MHTNFLVHSLKIMGDIIKLHELSEHPTYNVMTPWVHHSSTHASIHKQNSIVFGLMSPRRYNSG